MTFDVADLSGRAIELWEASCHADGKVIGPHDWDWWHLEKEEVSVIYDDFLNVPKPEDFSWMTDRLLESMRQLADEAFAGDGKDSSGNPTNENANSTLAQVSTTGDEIQDWTGTAADSFKTNYGDKFEGMVSSQFVAAFVMRHAINAEAAVWQTVREDLDKLSKDAKSTMHHCADSSTSDWTSALSVAAAVVSVAAAVPTGGASLSGWAAVGAGVTVTSTGIGLIGNKGTPEDEQKLKNCHPRCILDDLKARLTKLKEYIVTQEEAIATALDTSIHTINSGWGEYCLPAPELASAPRSDLGNGDNMGYPEWI